MIVRTLLDTDILTPPHWNIPYHRPVSSTTLVAVDDDNKIHGLCWSVYGGEVGLIIVWFSSEPSCMFLLVSAVCKLAKSLGCFMLLSHTIEGSRLLNILQRRGWIVNNSWKSVAVGIPTNTQLAALVRKGNKGGAE